MLTIYTMNFNHSWNGNRGRNRGNRGSTRNWRGGHYRGGSHFHRGAPPLLNSDNYYSPNRFRGHENFSNYYPHLPIGQNEQWAPRSRPPLLVNPRQSIPHNSHFQHQNPPRSLSPLPGSEEYMERNISEKSALLKRELELEGSGSITDSVRPLQSVNSDFQTDSANNNFFENTYPRECDEDKTVCEVSQSPRRSKKQRPISQSVEEIHQKIINHISNLSYNKKMNLVNLSGPSGYDIAIQEITRQKRMELSKVLRDMCHNKFKETEDSSQVINAIIPDFDIKIEELPREVVEQLSSTLDEDVTERVSMCIDPELMFQQAAEMLSTTLDIDKTCEEDNKTQVEADFNCVTFASEQISDEPIVDRIENKDSTDNAAPDESISTPTVPNIESCPPPTFTFDITESLEFDNSAVTKSINTPSVPNIESCPLPTFTFDLPEPLEFGIPSPVAAPPPSSQETDYIETPVTEFVKPEAELYSPGHESSNCSSPEPCTLNYDVMNMPEPGDIPIPQEVHTCAPPPNTDLAEETHTESDVLDLNNRGKISFNLNKRTLLKNDEFTENKSVKDEEEKSQASAVESQTEEKLEAPKVVESEIPKEDKAEKVRERKSRSKNKEAKAKETKEEKKIEKEGSPPKKVHKDRKNKSKTKDEDDEEKRKQEKKTKLKYETEEPHKIEKEDRSERKRDKYNVTETSRLSYDDDLERRKDKKSKNKYDDEYYSSKYERSKFDVYQGQGYDDGYRKRYRESPVVEDDKHRRTEHVERYREVEPDLYHYSKYPVEIEEGRNSKRYYHEKSVYRQEYEYPYNKYDYPSTEYYQRPEMYPSEEYDQKVHYSKTHKNKYKRHSKKHKRHRDRSSDSNVSSSGSEKNSSTSSFKTNKQTSKQSDLYDSSEEGMTNRLPKTSLMERLQVLCDTKLGGIKLEPVSPNPNDDARKCSNVNSEGDKSGSKNNSDSRKQPTRTSVDKQPSDKGDETTKQKDNSSSRTVEDTSSGTANTKNRSESEDDLKNSSEVESSESKNYKHRPWKSPGEKKFMMEHLHQNNANEDGVEVDAEHDTPTNEGLLSKVLTVSGEVDSLSTEKPAQVSCAKNVELPVVMPVEKETVSEKPKIIDKILAHAATQTIIGTTEHTYSQTVLDTTEKFTQATYEEEKKKVSSFSTQTVVSTVAASTQTPIAKTVEKGKLIQTDHVIIVDVAENVEVDESIPKTLRCKQFIDRMYEIDKEIDRLVKLRQSFYHLFLNVSDPDHEIKDLKGITDSPKSIPKLPDSKTSRSTPTPSIPERSTSKKRTPHTTSDRKNTPERSSRSHHKHTSADTKTSTPEPSKQKTAQSHRERSRKTDSKPVHISDKQKTSKSQEIAKTEKKESVERLEKKETAALPSAKVQHHGRGRLKKSAPHGSNEEKVKPSREEPSHLDEKKQKVTVSKETGRKRKLKNDETPDKEVKRLKKIETSEENVGDKERRAKKVEPAEVAPAEKEKSDEISNKEQKRSKKSDPVEATPVEETPKEAKHSKKSPDTIETFSEEAPNKEKRSKKSDTVESNSVEESSNKEKRCKKSDTVEASSVEDTPAKEAKRLKKLEVIEANSAEKEKVEDTKRSRKVDASEVEKVEDNETKRSKKSDTLEANPIVTESVDDIKRSKKSDVVERGIVEDKPDDAPNKEMKRSKKSEVVETIEREKEIEEIQNKEIKLSEAVDDVEKATTPSEDVEQETHTEKDTKPDDSLDTKTSEMEVTDGAVEEEKKDAVMDNTEAEEKTEVESKINGSFMGDIPDVMDDTRDETFEDRPITPGATLTSSDLASPPKKKKRRLSGMMAQYRKKKKKSKKSKKKDEKHLDSRHESPEHSARNVETVRVSAPSSVKMIRFSIEQLETMRNSIRSKHVQEQPLSDDSSVSNENPAADAEHEETRELSEEAVEPTEENASETDVVADDTNTSTSYSMEFKNFTGAILVIKVIENTVLAASDKGQLLSFDMLNGELLQTVEISSVAVTSIVSTCRNDITTIYLGSLDTRVTIFNFQTKEIVKQETVSEPVQCMEYSWNFIFIGSDRGTLIRFDLDTETVVDQTKISNFNILMMKASTEGPRKILVVATRNSPVSIRDALSGLLLRTMETSFSPTVYTLLIDKNLIYCGTSQHDILVYTFEDGHLARQHEATKSKGVVCMQILGNLLFAGCYNGNIYVYNIKTNAYLGIMSGPGGLMLSMEIVDDKIIVGTKSSNFKAWKIPPEYYEEK
uniref:Uncharacterized protein n=1 Tax=Photinus pyralis TaxID=7054 RepID=A0A1Y1MCW8_PHOPY